MDSAVHNGGAYQAIQQVSANHGGTWKPGVPYVNDAGTWRPWLLGPSASITNQDVSDFALQPTEAFAQYLLNNSGVAQTLGEAGWTNIPGEWRLSGVSADFEVRATLLSGVISSGTTGVWQGLALTREWSLSRSIVGTASAQLLIEIRRASDGVVITSATITLHASVESGA